MDWQTLSVAGIVGFAVAILARRAMRWASGSCDSSCGGCSKSPPRVATETIITDDEITLPK